MFFKNLIFYTITEELKHTSDTLQSAMNEHLYVPCKSQELSRYGWTNPCKEVVDVHAYEKHGCILIATLKEEKILPSQVIKDAVNKKVEAIQEEESRRVYKKERDQLKDEVILDLLPRAFSKYTKTYALINLEKRFIAVESSSYKRAEELLSFLRGTLGSLPICLPDVVNSPSTVMSHWLEHPPAQEEMFEILDECEMADNVLEGGRVSAKGQELKDEEFTAHLEAGKRVIKLALQWDEQLTFILKDDLRLSRIKLTDQFKERIADEAAEDQIAEFEADIVRMGLEFTKLFNCITKAFGGLADRP